MEKGAYLRDPSIPLRFELDITTVEHVVVVKSRLGRKTKPNFKNTSLTVYIYLLALKLLDDDQKK